MKRDVDIYAVMHLCKRCRDRGLQNSFYHIFRAMRVFSGLLLAGIPSLASACTQFFNTFKNQLRVTAKNSL